MGRVKHGRYTADATREGKGFRFRLEDESTRIVAEGVGQTVSHAQEDALEKASDEGVIAYLRQVKFIGILIEE